VLIASLTRAAAAEIAGRHLPIPRHAVGTLHAHCYHSLGRPELTESKIAEWNKENHARLQMTESEGENIDDAFPERAGRLPGDTLIQEYQLLRVKMIPRETWPSKVQAFAELWEDWKNQNSYYDFVDLIDYAYQDIDTAPGNPSFLIVDEAQDMDLLSVALIRKWSKHARATIFAGDAWQCQPAGSQVLTIDGYKNIEDLNSKKDLLRSWIIHAAGLLQRGLQFQLHQERRSLFMEKSISALPILCVENPFSVVRPKRSTSPQDMSKKTFTLYSRELLKTNMSWT